LSDIDRAVNAHCLINARNQKSFDLALDWLADWSQIFSNNSLDMWPDFDNWISIFVIVIPSCVYL